MGCLCTFRCLAVPNRYAGQATLLLLACCQTLGSSPNHGSNRILAAPGYIPRMSSPGDRPLEPDSPGTPSHTWHGCSWIPRPSYTRRGSFTETCNGSPIEIFHEPRMAMAKSPRMSRHRLWMWFAGLPAASGWVLTNSMRNVGPWMR